MATSASGRRNGLLSHPPPLSPPLPPSPPSTDVDDLESVDEIEDYINRSVTTLVFCTHGYCTSKNCMRELVATTDNKKPTIALVDWDMERGGLSLEQVQEQLTDAESSYDKWGFDGSASRGAVLYSHLLSFGPPIEWNRECAGATAPCQPSLS
jgi:hypothetical protein